MKSKYDMEMEQISAKDESSHGKILRQILPGTKVLECGCATGYMTRYMKEVIGAKVYIIENDKLAYQEAIQFAEDGICADLTENYWTKKFENEKFDCILFADVLEHLQSPETVLQKAVKLLKDDGKIIISIPNVTHNDVILSMCNNSWRYTSIGLLDDTHIRFFGEEDLDSLMESAGLCITIQDATIRATLTTEQKCSNQTINSEFLQYLKKRPYGEVYQFVLTAQKKEYVNEKKLEKKILCPLIDEKKSKLYFANSERELSENNCIERTFKVRDYYNFNFEIPNSAAKVIRFDPIENNACIVKDIQVHDNDGRELAIWPINGVRCDKYDIFCTFDPQYYISTENAIMDRVNIRAWIFPIYDSTVIDTFREIKGLIEKMKEDRNEYFQSSTTFQKREEDERMKNQLLSAQISNIFTINQELNVKLGKLSTEIAYANQDSKKMTENCKNIEREKLQIEKEYSDLYEQFKLCVQKQKSLEKNLDEIMNSTSWKLTSPFRRCMDIIKKGNCN